MLTVPLTLIVRLGLDTKATKTTLQLESGRKRAKS